MTELLAVLSTLGIGAVLGAFLTFMVATRQLRLKRRMDATESFLDICAHAHGRPRNDRSQHVGIAEQLAALKLMLGLANDFRFLRAPAREAFEAMSRHYGPVADSYSQEIAAAAERALRSLKPARRVTPEVQKALPENTSLPAA
ncbi:hypothetical protein [Arthrobacter sp. ov407]|uniref:hypothetical protein n=1 Tax=Arthrobacter sp. ov407 TaxID=1761748 RepID=UPI00115F79DC|nr:hypothetical protein [Arthrobacter sp. ov407]